MRGWLVALLLALAACDGTTGDVLTPRTQLPQATRLVLSGKNRPRGAPALRALAVRQTPPQDLPVDGVVLDLGFGESALGSAPLDEPGLAEVVNAARGVAGRFPESFQHTRLAPDQFADWFDDARFARAAANAEAAARVVRSAGLRGFFVDNQVYGSLAWAYPGPAAAGRSFAEMEALVASRGESLMAAVVRAFPDVTWVLSFAYSELLRDVCLEGQELEAHVYALYPAFLDGVLRAIETARAPATVIDGCLPAYPTVVPEHFAIYADLIHVRWASLVARFVPGITTHKNAAPVGERLHVWPATASLRCSAERFARLARERPAGFGLMIDYAVDLPPFSLDPSGFEGNRFSPERLRSSLAAALAASDRYVWLWHEAFDPYGLPGVEAPALPAAYAEAIRAARARP